MKRPIFYLLLLLLSFNSHAQDIYHQFYEADQENSISAIHAVEGDGFVISGERLFEGVVSRYFIAKLNAIGEVEWVQDYAASNQKGLGSRLIAVSSGGYVLAGTSTVGGAIGKSVIIRVDETGEVVWSKNHIAGGKSRVYGAIETADGGFAFSGRSNNGDIVYKLDADGNLSWYQSIRGNDGDGGASTFPIGELIELENGDIMATGYTHNLEMANSNGGVYCLDADGNIKWARFFGGSEDEHARRLTETIDGNVVVLSNTKSFGVVTQGFLLTKFNPEGELLWAKTYDTDEINHFDAIKEDRDGNLILVGRRGPIALCNSPNSYGAILKLTAKGEVIWSREVQGSYEFKEVEFSENGHYNIVGYHINEANVTEGVLINISPDGVGCSLEDGDNYTVTVRNPTISEEFETHSTVEIMDFFCAANEIEFNEDTYCFEEYVSIAENNLETGLIVYPIPSQINLNFKLKQNNELIQEVQIFDLKGQLVHKESDVNANSLMINLSHLKSGQYMFQLTKSTNKASRTINGRFLLE